MKRHFSLLGAAAGILMVVVDYLLPGGGKGGYAPSVYSTGLVFFIPGIGPSLPAVAPPLLWGFYCGWLPQLRDYTLRWVLTVAAIAAHLVPGARCWLKENPYRAGWSQIEQTAQLQYLILGAAIVVLLLQVASGRARADSNVDYRKRAE